jgi:hypothetical protein
LDISSQDKISDDLFRKPGKLFSGFFLDCNMKQFGFLLIPLLFLSCGGDPDSTQEQSELESPKEILSGTIFLSGQMAERLDINLKVTLPKELEGEVEGEYYYMSQKKPIELRGKREGNHLILDEFVDGEITGMFEGDLTVRDIIEFNGIWSNKKETEFKVTLSEFEEQVYDVYLVEREKELAGAYLDFESLKNSFKKVELPAEVAFSETKIIYDTNTIKKYFATESWEDWSFGWNEWSPIFRFETEEYVGLVVEHFYTPGAFGINNTFIELHTFKHDGTKIQEVELGCHCHDTNMGANDYYATFDNVTVHPKGRIEIARESIHATLFEEEMEEGQEPFDDRDSTYISINIAPDGTVVKK